MSRLSFSSASSQVVKGRGEDKCQRLRKSVITTISWHHFVWHVLLWMTACQPFYFNPLPPSMHLHAHLCEWAICRLYVFGCLVRCYTAHLVFRSTAVRYRAGLISGAELAVVGGVLKGLHCVVIAPLSLCCTLPLPPPFHTLFFCHASTQLDFGHVPLKRNCFCSEENTPKCTVNKRKR